MEKASRLSSSIWVRSLRPRSLLMAVPIALLVAACGSDAKSPSGSGGAAGQTAAGGVSGGGGAAPGAGGTGAPAGTGGAGAIVDAGGDVPSGSPGDGAQALDGLLAGDSGPTVIACPADVATATCTPGTLCTRKRPTGEDEGCGCIFNSSWYCPGLSLGSDGGIALPDGGISDAGGFPACAAGTMSGTACTSEGGVCTGGPGKVGCACTQLAGALHWVCL
jgi:hypothetical protein